MAETSYIIQNGRRLNLKDATARKSIGSCDELQTDTKHCLVMAINELNQKIGSGGGGEKGDPGATFTPSVDSNGNLSWSNNGGLKNPETVNIKGPKGETGYTPVKDVDYFDGRDGANGVSCTHSWNGTVLTVTSASGTSSADLKGEKGDTGTVEAHTHTPAEIGALPLSGGVTVTGQFVQKNLTLSDGVNTRTVVQSFDDGDTANNGSEVTISGAGNTFVGGGESPTNLRKALQESGAGTNEAYSATSERLYLSADTDIFLSSNCGTVANRKTARYTTAGALILPSHTDYSTGKARNIGAQVSDLTAGSTSLSNGTVWLIYE